MKTLDLNAMGVMEMTRNEIISLNGGVGWAEFLLGMADEIVKTWIGVCGEIEEWMKNNPDQVQYYRILHH